MKYGLSFLLCVLAIAGVYSQDNTTDYLLVARGMIEGIVSVKGWTDITSCITNNEGIVTGFSDAIATFQLNNTAAITLAAIKLGKALQIFPGALKACDNSIQISQDLVQNFSSFASLRDYVQIIGNNLAVYHIDLLKESYQATREYYQGHSKEFGNKVGQALSQVFLNGTSKIPPKPDENTTSPYLYIAQGVVEGIGAALHWDQVKPCIKEPKDSYNDISSAIQFFRAGDRVNVTLGFAAIGSVLQDIPAALQDCAGAYGKAANLTKALAAIEDAATYFSIVGKNALINGVDIYEEVFTASQDFDVGAWKDFGTNVGQTFAKLLLDNIDVSKKAETVVNFLEIDS
jgi:hypothetical protein